MNRNESGQLMEKYPDSAFFKAIGSIGNASAAEIAEIVGCNARVATIRLKRLVTENRIKSKKVSGRWIFWN